MSATNQIDLAYPIKINGQEINTLTIRRAKLKDQRAVNTIENPEERLLALLANLCEQTVDTLAELDVADYEVLVKKYMQQLQGNSTI